MVENRCERHGPSGVALRVSEAEYTTSIEDYLKAIYELSRGGEPAAVSEVADRLEVSRASVSGMVRRLVEQGLVKHEPYRGLELTETGRRGALRLLRRHRVIETYLVTVLSYRWDEVHAEAEHLEHAASDDLIRRMAAALGDPAVDPHGAPIPTAEGTVTEPSYVRLAELREGDEAVVARVDDEDSELLRYLGELGLMPGASIRCLAHEPFGGGVIIRARGKRQQLGGPLAARVLVRPA